ncbi:hypothetical protein Hypma_014005 [Hypsizygus marmoreus]|uniref:Uncharacterized protein n=1 Tax=Hypsizygus marmoreus TaxID=39966 RepID=A0A369K853_HYPMA|nr:hypothetical protein Hypma_014005 [Hypsizygus marmoreus]
MPPIATTRSISAPRRKKPTRPGRATSSHPSLAPACTRVASSSRATSSASYAAKTRKGKAVKAKQHELQELANLVFKYTELFEDTAASMRRDPEQGAAAYEREYPAALAARPGPYRTRDEIQLDLKDLAAKCEIAPKTFDDRMRICFAASAYSTMVMDRVVHHPEGPYTSADGLEVLRLVGELVRKRYGNSEAPPMGPPRLAKLIPDIPTTRWVTLKDVAHWRTHPQDLTRNAFIIYGGFRRVCFISDYALKQFAGHCYDVCFEDAGPDVFTFALTDLLEMVTGAELVTNLGTV